MIKQTKITKIFQLYTRGCINLIIVMIALELPELHAQESSDNKIAAILKILEETSNTLESRVATLRNRLEQNRAYLIVLKERLQQADNEANETIRLHKLSRYAYQTFMVTSRIEAEEVKLKETETLISFIPRLGASTTPSLLKEEFEQVTLARINAAERLLQEANTFQFLITEPVFRMQFATHLETIRTDLERFKQR